MKLPPGIPISASVLALSLLLLVYGAAAAAHAPQPEALTLDGESRHYLLYVPAQSRPRAVVLLLHGHGGSGGELLGTSGRAAPFRRWIALAEREGLVLAAPDGLRGGDHWSGWNDCRRSQSNPGSDDVRFLTLLVQHLAEQYRIDPKRVFVSGISNGGVMALRLAVERPQVFRAVAAVAAAMPAESVCAEPAVPVPILFMNGTADRFMRFEGGGVVRDGAGRGKVLSADASAARWVKLNGAAATARRERLPDLDPGDQSRVTRLTWAPGSAGAAVVLYRIEGGGHNEPSRSERYRPFVARLLGPQNGDIEMADEVWAFFAAQIK